MWNRQRQIPSCLIHAAHPTMGSIVTTARQAELDLIAARPARDLVFRTPPNWTAVIFFATLATLHTCICVPAFFHGRWEGYMSLIFALIFIVCSITSVRFIKEMAVLPIERLVRVRIAVGRFQSER